MAAGTGRQADVGKITALQSEQVSAGSNGQRAPFMLTHTSPEAAQVRASIARRQPSRARKTAMRACINVETTQPARAKRCRACRYESFHRARRRTAEVGGRGCVKRVQSSVSAQCIPRCSR